MNITTTTYHRTIGANPAFALIAALFLSNGCGGTPEPEPAPDPVESRQLFYSEYLEPAEDYESEFPTLESGESPAGEEDYSAAETGELIADQGETPFPEKDPAGITDGSYLINPHDLLDISVLGESDLSLTVRVSERGVISFPLLGEIRAAGYTPIQLERKLETLLGKDYLVSPSVNVAIKEYSTISVLGQVQKPGSFEIKGRLTVTRAIAQAGGLTPIASPNGTRIIRKYNGREETIPVRLNDILKDGDLSQDIPLLPGDLIVVPESFF